mmetsp:Transcript_30150/g.66740  ORF Transcript_30150/g.66740 Transcript_30150/m.66740 type:complete len:268 (-) Transcript_30150:859-1662(-)
MASSRCRSSIGRLFNSPFTGASSLPSTSSSFEALCWCTASARNLRQICNALTSLPSPLSPSGAAAVVAAAVGAAEGCSRRSHPPLANSTAAASVPLVRRYTRTEGSALSADVARSIASRSCLGSLLLPLALVLVLCAARQAARWSTSCTPLSVPDPALAPTEATCFSVTEAAPSAPTTTPDEESLFGSTFSTAGGAGGSIDSACIAATSSNFSRSMHTSSFSWARRSALAGSTARASFIAPIASATSPRSPSTSAFRERALTFAGSR